MTSPSTAPAVFRGSVSESYRHGPKNVRPAAAFELGATVLKWYDLAVPGTTLDDGIRREAQAFLTRETDAGRLPVGDDAGFVILHLCGDSFYFLLVNLWRGDNELWEAAYTRDDGPFQVVRSAALKATYCVWELGAVLHEQQAWSRFLSSERTRADREAYLGDTFEGTV
jgi:hypothetical protein